MGAHGHDKWRWNFIQAYPVKWIGPELRVESSTVAFETIELREILHLFLMAQSSTR
jgi:hypothetical protein